MQVLSQHSWKGNVRELRNLVERLLIMAPKEMIDVADLPIELREPARSGETAGIQGGAPTRAGSLSSMPATLKDFKETAEKEFILSMLERNGWNISRTAKEIDTPRSNLYKKLEQYGIAKDKVAVGDADDAEAPEVSEDE
jgi:two-component system nitrogen regulation response regulator NtrX